jgi:electron-transferring-flavoprotein dehydrogenase
MQRETMEYDVVIVGAGPAGLSTAIRLRQLALESDLELTVCVLEKGSEVGAHILSGALFEPRALNELVPDWQDKHAPLNTPVEQDDVYFFTRPDKALKVPALIVPRPMHNKGNYIVSLGNLCRWLAEQAEALDVDIFPGFPAADIIYDDNVVRGVTTGDMGMAADGTEKNSFEPGIELHGKYTIFSEGCRGHLGKRLIEKFKLDKDSDPQHYALGIKELWEVSPDKHQSGLVIHGAGWPLSETATNGGFFLYHLEDNQVSVGLITDLNYSNPYLNPYLEFQRFKHHPLIKQYLSEGRRVSYGARAISKGGYFSLPRMVMPGAMLLGCDAGTLNFSRIKGAHTAMKSGMLAAETIADAFARGDEGGQELTGYVDRFNNSWLYKELYSSRNFGSVIHKWGPIIGGGFNYLDQNWFGGKLPVTLRDQSKDHQLLNNKDECSKIDYPKPDGEISFDLLSSVYLSSTNHEEDQPCHLSLQDAAIPIDVNLKQYDAPEQRYCPAGVYEILSDESSGKSSLQINAQNCLHCKTCDIKDPSQNINWITPEGGGGPNYPNM